MGKLQTIILNFRKDSGQAAVEYILLIAVVMTIAVTVLKSDAFNKLLGPDSNIFNSIKKKMEYTYRHGVYGTEDETPSGYGGAHDSYYKGSTSRFFTPTAKYP